MELQAGDILLYETDTVFGGAVRRVTGYKYSHVAIAVDSNHIIEANAFIKTRVVDIKDSEFNHVRIMRLKKNLTVQQQKTISDECHLLLGMRYDYWGVFMLYLKIMLGLKLDPLKDDVTRFWCSELVDFVYLKAGVDLVEEIHNSYVSVQDIAESKALFHVGDLYTTDKKPC